MMYDVIGDIHGHADGLELLLTKLEYLPDGLGYRHPERQAVFVGDFIDRGPKIARALEIVRSMTGSGAAVAVMGNHEFNAIAYHTPKQNGSFYREHNQKNEQQHEATLEQLLNR